MVVIGPLSKAEEDRLITLHELLKFLDAPGRSSNTGTPGTPCSNADSPGTPHSNTDPVVTPYLADDAVIIVLKPTAIEFERKTKAHYCNFTPAERYGVCCILSEYFYIAVCKCTLQVLLLAGTNFSEF